MKALEKIYSLEVHSLYINEFQLSYYSVERRIYESE